MDIPVAVEWALVALFTVLAMSSLYRLVRADPLRVEQDQRENDLAELLVVLAMAAMVSPLGGPIPAAGWQAVLVLTAGWFVVAAVRGRRCCAVHHAIAAIAMLYMISAMPAHEMDHGPWLTMSGATSARLAFPAIAALAAAYFAYDAVRGGTLAIRTARTAGIRHAGFLRPACRTAMGIGMSYMLVVATL
jgi:uncharacterized protein DUF5134